MKHQVYSPITFSVITVFTVLAFRKSTLHLYSPASSSWTGSSWRKAGLLIILKYALFSKCGLADCRAWSTVPRRASSVYIGAGSSPLYHNIKTTESSTEGGDISHGSATLPLTTAVYKMVAVEEKREDC